MHLIANKDKIGTSRLDLYFFKLLYLLTFKRYKWLKKQIVKVTEDLETVKNRKIF